MGSSFRFDTTEAGLDYFAGVGDEDEECLELPVFVGEDFVVYSLDKTFDVCGVVVIDPDLDLRQVAIRSWGTRVRSLIWAGDMIGMKFRYKFANLQPRIGGQCGGCDDRSR